MSLIRNITDAEIAAFETDGVVHLKGFFNPEWVSMLQERADFVLQNPGKLANELAQDTPDGRFFSDTFLWHQNDGFKEFIYRSPAAEIVGQVMASTKINIVFDQFLIKEPSTDEPTVWHHDLTYWPIKGPNVVTLWLALDDVTEETGSMEFVKGSHLWGERYHPVAFVNPTKYDTPEPPVPDIDNRGDEFELSASTTNQATAQRITGCFCMRQAAIGVQRSGGAPTSHVGRAMKSCTTRGRIYKRCCGSPRSMPRHRSTVICGPWCGHNAFPNIHDTHLATSQRLLLTRNRQSISREALIC